jgi:hypothetical protein
MPQSLRLRAAGARAAEERENFTDYFSGILASICIAIWQHLFLLEDNFYRG